MSLTALDVFAPVRPLQPRVMSAAIRLNLCFMLSSSLLASPIRRNTCARTYNRLLKTPRSPFKGVRARPERDEGATGAVLEMIAHFPFVLSLWKHA